MKYKVCDSKNDNLTVAEFVSSEEAVAYCNRRNNEEGTLLFVENSEGLSDKTEYPKVNSSDTSCEQFFYKISLLFKNPYFSLGFNLTLLSIMLMVLPGLFENGMNARLSPFSKFQESTMNLIILFFAFVVFLEIINKGILFFSSKRRLDIRLLVVLKSESLRFYLMYFMTLFGIKFIDWVGTLAPNDIVRSSFLSSSLPFFILFIFHFLLFSIFIVEQSPFDDLRKKIRRRSWRV